MTLGTWIKVKFGTHIKLNEALGLGKNTVNRWYNTDPKRFLMYLTQLSKWSDTEVVEIINMISQREEDVAALRN
jgi:hypothetical protein